MAADNKWDVAKFVGKKFSDKDREELCRNCWMPPENFKFPVHSDKRRFIHSWMGTWPWLRYSQDKDGAYCLCCVLFIQDLFGVGRGSHQSAQRLVSLPLLNWRKATGVSDGHFSVHERTEYHRTCFAKFEALKGQIFRGDPNVLAQVQKTDHRSMDLAARNRNYLSKIVDVVLLLARQNIAFRGSEDFGRISVDEIYKQNTGNFRALLIHQMGYDSDLKESIEMSAGNARYTSPQIQNELIEICGDYVKNTLREEIKEAQFSSVLADEATDVNMDEQLVILVRYVTFSSGNATIKEEFLTFLKVTDLTGRGLAESILTFLKGFGLDMNFLVGQGLENTMACKLQ